MQYRYDYRDGSETLEIKRGIIIGDVHNFTGMDVSKVNDLVGSGIHVFRMHYDADWVFSFLTNGMSGGGLCDGVKLENAIRAAVSYAHGDHAVDIHPLIVSGDVVLDPATRILSRTFMLVSHCGFDGFRSRDAFADFLERVAELDGSYELLDCVDFNEALNVVGGLHRFPSRRLHR